MVISEKSHSKRTFFITLLIIVIVLALGAGGYYWYTQRNKSVSSYAECVAMGNQIMTTSPEQCTTPEGKRFTNPDSIATFEGTAVCLPHKDSNGPQTMECAVGIKTTDGIFYGISGDTESKLSGMTGTDKKVRVTGKVEKSTDTIYDIDELINVSKIELL
ncbi:MAG TPA: hypothetical protein VFH06_02195 [Candidatus Saccharimonadales bacterium]|nr:hypothetical protein [Candidatus Saccharimonadales bacterium]